MARKALINKANAPPKFSTRKVFRCQLCGRSRGNYRKFQICRLCFRKLASFGHIPGVRKASW
jgi:small subunit ribosomal protein S14